MKARNRISAFFVSLFAATLLFGTAYSAWGFAPQASADQAAQVGVPDWDFDDSDFAKAVNVNGLGNLTAAKEESITYGSSEAIRLTNTAGTQTKDHTFYINLDREYALSEIATYKIEFDYYHAFKREQHDKGFPKVQLYSNNVARGSEQGGTETVTNISPFVAIDLDSDWWHLEYYVTSLCPTMADHQDTPIPLTYKINRVKIVDRAVYDYDGVTAFMVIDNMSLSPEPAARLGLFNRTTSYSAGTYYWFKVAWSGELHSCVITTSDPTVAIQDTESEKSPFYVYGIKKGKVLVTATLEIGDDHRIMSVSNTVTVN